MLGNGVEEREYSKNETLLMNTENTNPEKRYDCNLKADRCSIVDGMKREKMFNLCHTGVQPATAHRTIMRNAWWL